MLGKIWINKKHNRPYLVVGTVVNATNNGAGQTMVLYTRDKVTYVREKEEFLEKFARHDFTEDFNQIELEEFKLSIEELVSAVEFEKKPMVIKSLIKECELLAKTIVDMENYIAGEEFLKASEYEKNKIVENRQAMIAYLENLKKIVSEEQEAK